MKWALIKNGKVENVIIANKQFITKAMSSQYDHCVEIIALENPPGVGWLYSKGKFTDPGLKTSQEEREEKLTTIRDLRDAKLKEVDLMCNEIALAIRNDKKAVRDYREALLSLTDDLKNEDGSAAEAIDSIVLTTLEWPAKPTRD